MLSRHSLYSTVLRMRNRHLFVLDAAMVLLTPIAALLVRIEALEAVTHYANAILAYTALSMAWKLVAFYASGFYNRYWRMADIYDVAHLTTALTIVMALNVCMMTFALRPAGFLVELPRSIPLIDGMLTMIGVGATRFAMRLTFSLNRAVRRPSPEDLQRTLIVGAGVAGSMIVKEMRSNPYLGFEPIGFVDDDPNKLGIRIHGVQVLGTLTEIIRVIRMQGVREVVIAMPNAPGRAVRSVVHACEKAGVKSKTIPGIFELLEGKAKVSELRDVQIEDLLRRGTIQADFADAKAVMHKKRVLVTGAGGSIGSELCRQIMQAGPAELTLVGHGEDSIFRIAGELRQQAAGTRVKLHTVIADIRDAKRIRRVFVRHKPQIIFHAAAHKHVGLMEVNVADAVTNNVFGTQNLLRLAVEQKVERFVMISSDKAVNPGSVMGVTKRVAELLVRDTAVRTGLPYVTVRFGNVLGSRGSVVPIFQRQIASGGPVLVTHPDVTRFFMTIPEAVQLVLQAAGLGKGGGETFVLDMGEPIRIVDLARDVIRLSGLEEGRDVEIVFTGLKVGEKMCEELFYPDEEPDRSANEKIFVCRSAPTKGLKTMLDNAGVLSSVHDGVELPDGEQLQQDVQTLIACAEAGGVPEIVACLKKIVPEYEGMRTEAESLGQKSTDDGKGM